MDGNTRVKVSIRDIVKAKSEDLTPGERAALPRDFFEYKPKLYKNLTMPSYVHGYSLAIEYMRKWFLKKFDNNYFKYVHINGKHVLDDWKRFNNYNIVKEKPMLAIVPTVDFDYDRDQVDQYMMDHTLFLKRSDYQQSFLKDYERMNFLYVQMKELKMDFTFKVRVNSRSEQLDLFHKMEMWFRIGSTQTDFVSADFHIPYDVMLNIAHDCNFKIENNNIVDIYDFLSYLNKHSDIPIVFKMRAINQKPEFFMRVKNLRTHITTIDKLSMDDGERQGKLDTNFHIEMRCSLKIPIPHFYVYFCQDPIQYTIGTVEPNDTCIGVYSINPIEIEPENELGWGQIAVTGYMTDIGEDHIDLSSILYNAGDLANVIKYSMKQGISPDSFLDIRVYRGDVANRRLNIGVDYRTCTIFFEKPETVEEDLDIIIYADKEYMNNTILSANNYFIDNRIS